MDPARKKTLVASSVALIALVTTFVIYGRVKKNIKAKKSKEITNAKVGDPVFLDGLYTLQNLQYGYLRFSQACSSHSCSQLPYDLNFSSNPDPNSALFVFERIGTQNSGKIKSNVYGSTSNFYLSGCKDCGSTSGSDICINGSIGATWILYTKNSDSSTYYIRTVDGSWMIPNSNSTCSSLVVGLSDPGLTQPPSNALGFIVNKIV